MDFCRSCLETKNLSAMNETFITNYNLLTNLNINLEDGLSQYVCKTCCSTVVSYIKFRDQCIISERKIKNMIEIKPENIMEYTDFGMNKTNNCIKLENVKIESEDDNMDDAPLNIEHNHIVDEKKSNRKCNMQAMKIKPKKVISKPSYSLSIEDTEPIKLKKKKIKVKTEDRNLLCGLCLEICDDRSILCSHVDNHKNDTMCLLCRKEFTSWSKLLTHRYDHIPASQRRCHVCFRKNKVIETLVLHYMNTHFGGKGHRVNCRKCDKSFGSANSLHRHVPHCQYEGRKIYVCDHCSKRHVPEVPEDEATKPKRSLLTNHMTCHMDGRPLICTECGKTFKRPGSLKSHMVFRHCSTRVDCAKCYRVFKDQESHDKHKCSPKNLICPDCGKQFDRDVTFNSHRLKHDKVGRFKCTLCPATFKHRNVFNVHMDKHSGVKRFQCKHCDAKFQYGSSLTKHMRRHTGERPYVCEICEKGFVTRYHLKIHMETHGIYLINKQEKTA